jgi:hypothetical protein
VHLTGDAMKAELARSDVGVILTEPSTYWRFAMPVKLFEYLGAGLPVIASEGTSAADFLLENGCGWAIPYTCHAIRTFLKRFTRSDINRVSEKVRQVAACNTWEDRARTVVAALKGLNID